MVLSEEEGAKLKAELKEVSVFDEKAQQTVRAMTYFTWEAEEDKQGRILLPAELRQYAKIEKDVIVIKTPSCIEIWAKEVWEKYIAELNFTYLADAISNISKK